MNYDFSKYFHLITQEMHNNQPQHPSPGSEKRGWWLDYHKSYDRLPQIALPDVSSARLAPLHDVLQQRHTTRSFSRAPVDLETIATMLHYSAGFQAGEPQHRMYPSAGGRFAVEIYPIIFREDGDVRAGVYHYNPTRHSLEQLHRHAFSDAELQRLFTYEWIMDAGAAFIVTGVFWRTQHTYGERGYRYVVAEAGHVAQNLALTATALELAHCELGGMRETNLETLLDITDAEESILLGVLIGS